MAYTVEHVDSTELVEKAEERLKGWDGGAFVDVLEAHLYGDGAGHAVKGDGDNAVLGLEREDLREVLRRVLV